MRQRQVHSTCLVTFLLVSSPFKVVRSEKSKKNEGGNNFAGELLVTLGNLKTLTNFRIDGNGISGRIPDFIGNWTSRNRLRIADLNGPSIGFPDLQNLTINDA